MELGDKMNKNCNRVTKGFTLIEVLIAIAIVALIAVVSLPLFSMGVQSVNKAEKQSVSLFEIESRIESDSIALPSGDTVIEFNFPGRVVSIPVYEFEVEGDNSDSISIYFFKYKSD